MCGIVGYVGPREAEPILVEGLRRLEYRGYDYAALRKQLQGEGVSFKSDTDTEVIAHLVARHLQGDLADAVLRTLPMLKGTYGLAVVSRRQPDVVVGARLGSPLVIGVGQGEHF